MTHKVYLTESYKKEHVARVTGSEDGCLMCDETIFYPQGGGQPTDKGTICRANDPSCFQVSKVSYDRSTGLVKHTGTVSEGGPFNVGDEVEMKIDWAFRYLHMRLHSGGHLIDHAVQFLGLPFEASKACHFPNMASVEFRVLDQAAFPVDKESLATFKTTLQAKCDAYLAQDPSIRAWEEEKRTAESVAQTHQKKAEGLPMERIRMVQFEGSPAAVPCGGTHVARASEIGRVEIRKVTFKDGIIRIAYNIA